MEGLERRKIEIVWGTNVRADYFTEEQISLDFARRLRDVSIKFLSIGAESGSDRVLGFLKKDITVRDILNSARTCSLAGIVPVYSWMCGIPTETKKEMEMTLSLIREVTRICPSAIHYNPQVYRPYPGGELYEWCKKGGLYEPSSVEEWRKVADHQDPNTGAHPVRELHWLDDYVFVEFVSTFMPEMVGINRSRNLFYRLLSSLPRKLVGAWDYPVVGWLAHKAAYMMVSTLQLVRNMTGSSG